MLQLITATYYTLGMAAVRILAAPQTPTTVPGSSGSTGGGSTVSDFTSLVNSDAFKLPLAFFKVMAVLFFFWMIFKIVEAVAQSKWPRALGLLIAGALVIFMAWNPVSVLIVLDMIGGVFRGVIEVLEGMM